MVSPETLDSVRKAAKKVHELLEDIAQNGASKMKGMLQSSFDIRVREKLLSRHKQMSTVSESLKILKYDLSRTTASS